MSTQLNIQMVPQSEIDERTNLVRYTHPNTCGWFSTTQCWKWGGGDAIVVVTGRIPYDQTYVTLRLGDEVHSVPAGGICQALEAYGYKSKVVC